MRQDALQMIRPAQRRRAKLRIGLGGVSGSGKTYSALLLAYGLTGDWTKICVLDSENESADLYEDLGPYFVYTLRAFGPDDYTQAIRAICADKRQFQVLIIDSMTHEWAGTGGCLEQVDRAPAKSKFTGGWKDVTPRHNTFVQSWLQAPLHVIGTLRKKDDYVLTEKDGKQVPQKVGLKNIQRDALEYEFTLFLDVHQDHYCTVSKDRTGLFDGRPPFMIDETTGHALKQWAERSAIMRTTIFQITNPAHIERLEKWLDEENVETQYRALILDRMVGEPFGKVSEIKEEICNGETEQGPRRPDNREATEGVGPQDAA